MQKNKIDRDIVVVLVMTLITVVSWAGFEVYRAYTKIVIAPVLAEQLREVNPVLDLGVLEIIEKREP